jgi:hypothetical protein
MLCVHCVVPIIDSYVSSMLLCVNYKVLIHEFCRHCSVCTMQFVMLIHDN